MFRTNEIRSEIKFCLQASLLRKGLVIIQSSCQFQIQVTYIFVLIYIIRYIYYAFNGGKKQDQDASSGCCSQLSSLHKQTRSDPKCETQHAGSPTDIGPICKK